MNISSCEVVHYVIFSIHCLLRNYVLHACPVWLCFLNRSYNPCLNGHVSNSAPLAMENSLCAAVTMVRMCAEFFLFLVEARTKFADI
jgi:hypothetical protein